MIGKRIDRRTHDEEIVDKAYWLSRPISERLDAVTRLRAQLIKQGEHMDRTAISKRNVR